MGEVEKESFLWCLVLENFKIEYEKKILKIHALG